MPLETRVSSTVLAKHRRRAESSSVNGDTGLRRAGTNYIVPLVVNRAASSTAMGELEAFYVGGMGTTKTVDSSSGGLNSHPLASTQPLTSSQPLPRTHPLPRTQQLSSKVQFRCSA